MQATADLKKTPLHNRHVVLGAKIVDFSGWAMPVYYKGIIQEHLAVRERCGVFDVSHLGEIRVKGPGSRRFLQHRLTNDMEKLSDEGILYHLICDEKGGILDDILVYQESAEDYYLIVNAGNIAVDFEELKRYAPASVEIRDHSDEMACIAVQGPQADAMMLRLDLRVSDLGYYRFRAEKWKGETVWISRSGYTGEDGFDIFCPNAMAGPIWDALAVTVPPCGLGARNTLRLEAGNVLCGNDIDRTTTPIEAGLSWAVAMDKPGGFVGRDALLKQKENGPARKLACFKMLDKPVAREHYPIFKDGKKIGMVTSGSFGPSVGCNIGMGYLQKGRETPGTRIEIEIHGRLVPAEIVKRPFVELKHKGTVGRQ